MFIDSDEEAVGYMTQSVCLFVCLELDKAKTYERILIILWRGWSWPKDELIRYCWRFGVPVCFGS